MKVCTWKGKGESCHNCCKSGHVRKECKNEKFCYLYEAAGHNAESVACPTFRGLVEKERTSGAISNKS